MIDVIDHLNITKKGVEGGFWKGRGGVGILRSTERLHKGLCYGNAYLKKIVSEAEKGGMVRREREGGGGIRDR